MNDWSKAMLTTKTLKKNDRVNCLWSDGEQYPGVIASKTAKGVNVEFDDGETTFVPNSKVGTSITIRKRGRKTIEETCTATEIKKQVSDLLKELKGATDVDEKKRLRRALRRRGHVGGLGIREKGSAGA